jgi:hypothetical protein
LFAPRQQIHVKPHFRAPDIGIVTGLISKQDQVGRRQQMKCPKLTSRAKKGILNWVTGFLSESKQVEMKTVTKNGKLRANGSSFTRSALLAAHERALKRASRLTAREGFSSLVKAGIYTPNGKLAPRYGG